jgi:hypothetical protein
MEGFFKIETGWADAADSVGLNRGSLLINLQYVVTVNVDDERKSTTVYLTNGKEYALKGDAAKAFLDRLPPGNARSS